MKHTHFHNLKNQSWDCPFSLQAGDGKKVSRAESWRYEASIYVSPGRQKPAGTNRETCVLRKAYHHGILPSLLGREGSDSPGLQSRSDFACSFPETANSLPLYSSMFSAMAWFSISEPLHLSLLQLVCWYKGHKKRKTFLIVFKWERVGTGGEGEISFLRYWLFFC